MGDRINIYDGAKLAVFALTEWSSKTDSGTRFTQIGNASVNRDGSVNLYLDLLPGKGQTLQIRTVKKRDTSPPPPRRERGPDGAGDESPDRPF